VTPVEAVVATRPRIREFPALTCKSCVGPYFRPHSGWIPVISASPQSAEQGVIRDSADDEEKE